VGRLRPRHQRGPGHPVSARGAPVAAVGVTAGSVANRPDTVLHTTHCASPRPLCRRGNSHLATTERTGGPLKEMPPLAPQRRPNSPCFMHLFRLVLTRSRCPQLAKANQFLAHLALLAGPEALSRRPATAQKSLGRGRRPPPCAPPCAAARRPGWATPSPKPPRGGG
jgi:hypothetical protein